MKIFGCVAVNGRRDLPVRMDSQPARMLATTASAMTIRFMWLSTVVLAYWLRGVAPIRLQLTVGQRAPSSYRRDRPPVNGIFTLSRGQRFGTLAGQQNKKRGRCRDRPPPRHRR